MFDRLLAGVQHAKNAKALHPVGTRRFSRHEAIEEMGALFLQRLGLLQLHRDRLRLDGLWSPVGPIDPMRIKEELLFRGVVENGHLLRADDDEALLLRRVEPTDENVAGHSAAELQAAERHVHHAGRQVALPVGFRGDRLFAQQVKDDGNVVGSEAPEDVLFRPDQAHVQPVGIAVEDPSQGAFLNQLAEADDRRVIKEDVSDHEDGARSLGQGDQFLALPGVQGQRLFDEDVFARFEATADDVVMGGGGGGHGHGPQRRVVEDLLQVVGEGGPGARKIEGVVIGSCRCRRRIAGRPTGRTPGPDSGPSIRTRSPPGHGSSCFSFHWEKPACKGGIGD